MSTGYLEGKSTIIDDLNSFSNNASVLWRFMALSARENNASGIFLVEVEEALLEVHKRLSRSPLQNPTEALKKSNCLG